MTECAQRLQKVTAAGTGGAGQAWCLEQLRRALRQAEELLIGDGWGEPRQIGEAANFITMQRKPHHGYPNVVMDPVRCAGWLRGVSPQTALRLILVRASSSGACKPRAWRT